LKNNGVQAEFEVILHHAPDVAITESARGKEGTLIAMSTHGRSGFTRWMLGSVTDHVVRTSGAPVLVVRPPQE
jgi:nucleotide-binding universal stress UspA family protein